MKHCITAAVFSFFCFFIFSNISCKLSATQPYQYPGTPEIAPAKTLPAREIMRLQGLNSIHFAIYDSSIVNGDIYYAPAGYSEYYIDTSRIKIIEYNQASGSRNIRVYDMNKGIVWKSINGKVENLSISMEYISELYRTEIQPVLGNGLEGPLNFTGQGHIENMRCNIFEDTRGFQEWVWINHRLPVRYIRTWNYDNISQTTYIQIRDIEVNKKFSDSIFVLPMQ